MAEAAGAPETPALERKLATILSADVAEYSRLMAEDEEGTLRTFRSHREVFEQIVALHRGRVFNTAGDAILAEFASAVEAVRCATEVQAALHTWNEQLPPPRQVRFRIGVNIGDVMVQGRDLLGDGVNVAARLQGAAEPGGVCISGSVYDQIRNKLSLTFKSMGERTFKNIPQPIRTFSIVGSAVAGMVSPPTAARGGRAGVLKALAAGVLAALALGGGYAGYSAWQRGTAERARLLAEAESGRQEAARREAQLGAAREAAEEARRRAEAEQRAAEAARREAQIAVERARSEQAVRLAEAEKKRAEEQARRATENLRAAEESHKKREADRQAAAAPPPAAAPVPPPLPSVASLDGVYAGPVCYGPAPYDRPRCYRAQGTVADGKITGRWPGRDPGMTMMLSGLVSASGAVQMEIRGDRAIGSRWPPTINLTGTLRDGKLDATGRFGDGRPADLAWQRQ
jgi:class 3 adenylate cyclase